MKQDGETTVVSFVSIKGGTGKTNISILLARALVSSGKRVLLVDFDLNNSLSFYFLDDAMMEKTKLLNIAKALNSEDNNLCDYAVQTRFPGIDLIASTPYLADMRTMNDKRLKRMIPSLQKKYNIVILDCPPTYDNIVLNAVNASDFTITPVLKDTFSYNAACFLADVLPRDADLKNWYILINGFNSRFENAKAGRQKDFIELYKKNEGFTIMPQETWLPWTSDIHFTIDYRTLLTCNKSTSRSSPLGAVYSPGLHTSIAELAGCFFDEGLKVPEVF
jgi:chromosome partitioning protein